MDQQPERNGDVELVRGARSGDPAALEAFLWRMRCIPRFLAARNERLGRPLGVEDLADASQHVFALIWAKAAAYRGDSALETWVYTFCSLTLANRARHRSTGIVRLDDSPRELASPDASRALGDALDDKVIRDALQRIEPLSALVIELKQFDDLTFEQISERLGIPPNTAKSRYYRGLASLRDRLHALEPGDEG